MCLVVIFSRSPKPLEAIARHRFGRWLLRVSRIRHNANFLDSLPPSCPDYDDHDWSADHLPPYDDHNSLSSIQDEFESEEDNYEYDEDSQRRYERLRLFPMAMNIQ
jgi:hypothetical protein